jgi:hypothetical protein
MCLTKLANNITVLGGTIMEGKINKKMLHMAPKPLEQVAISSEMVHDLDRLMVEEVTGHLRNIEQCKKMAASDCHGRLPLTEEERWVCMFNHNNISEGRGSGGSGNGDGAKKLNKPPKLDPDGKPIRCTNCVMKGHLGKDCWSNPKRGKAHVAQAEEEENTLFLVSATIDTPFIPNQ